MNCGYCGRPIHQGERVCPHCGRDPFSGVYQTSTILIATAKGKAVYNSVPEVPPRLRVKLVRSTTGSNAGTIIIADRRGRREIAAALRRSGGESPARPARQWRRWALALLPALVALAVVALQFFRQ